MAYEVSNQPATTNEASTSSANKATSSSSHKAPSPGVQCEPSNKSYNELETLARETLEKLEIVATSKQDCWCILTAFQEYQRNGQIPDSTLNLSAVVMEVRLCVYAFARDGMFPDFIKLPKKHCLTHDAEVEDSGNDVLELMITIIKLSSASHGKWQGKFKSHVLQDLLEHLYEQISSTDNCRPKRARQDYI